MNLAALRIGVREATYNDLDDDAANPVDGDYSATAVRWRTCWQLMSAAR